MTIMMMTPTIEITMDGDSNDVDDDESNDDDNKNGGGDDNDSDH